MTSAWLPALLMLVSGSVHAVVNAMIKNGANRMVQMTLSSATGAGLALLALPFVPLPSGAWHWLALAGLVHIAYFYCLVRALDGGDLSAAYPIFRGTAPLVTLALALIWLREPITPLSIAGIALIAGGMLAMVAGRHVDRATLGWSLAAGVLIALYTVIDARGVRAAPNPLSFISWLFLLMGILSLLVLPHFAREPFLAAARAQWRGGMLAGLLSVLTFGLALFALAHGPTAPLAALRETGMVTALLISIFILKEPVTRARATAILGICCGAGLLIGA